MARTVSIVVRYPVGYEGPGLPPVTEVLAAGGRFCRVAGRAAIRFPPPDDDVVLVDGERMTLAKVRQVREAWTRLAVRDVLRDVG